MRIFKVKEGSFTKDALILKVDGKEEKYNWKDVKVIALGKITTFEEEIEYKVVLSSEGEGVRVEPDFQKKTQLYWVVELLISDPVRHFRFYRDNIKYKGFLKSLEYSSILNFKRFLQTLAFFAADAIIDKSLENFLLGQGQGLVKEYISSESFEKYCQKLLLKG